MSTSTLICFEVDTYASKEDRRTITVLAKDRAAAAAQAIAGHRAAAGLPSNVSVLTSRIVETTNVRAVAPPPMSKAQQARMAWLRRQSTGGNDAA